MCPLARIGEGRASARGHVGLQVRLRQPEFLTNPFVVDVRLVQVERVPVHPVAAADVADLDRRVARHLRCQPTDHDCV